jgi:hypothetical protein
MYSSPDKRADSTVDNTEDVSLLTPSWCVLCPGNLGDFGEFMANLEYHGGMESVIFFHRSAGAFTPQKRLPTRVACSDQIAMMRAAQSTAVGRVKGGVFPHLCSSVTILP